MFGLNKPEPKKETIKEEVKSEEIKEQAKEEPVKKEEIKRQGDSNLTMQAQVAEKRNST